MRRITISVVGAHDASPALLQAAHDIGRGIADAGWRLACGGRNGIMEAACRGAHSSASWIEGTTLGILPDDHHDGANPYVDVVVPTGMGFGRNLLVVLAGDVVVALGGGSGTLSEIAYAWQYDRPIVALDIDEGWSSKLAGTALDRRARPAIVRAQSADEVIAAVQAIVDARPA